MSGRSDLSLWRGLWPFIRPWGRLWLAAAVLAPATAVATILQPWLLRTAIDHHIIAGDVPGLMQAAWLYLGAVAVGFACQVGHTALLSVAATRTITDLRRAAFRHLLGQRAAFFDREPTGRLLTRVTNDIEALGETLNAGAFTLVVDALQVIGVLAAMLWLDWRLTCVLLLVGPPLVLIIDVLRRKLRELFNETHTSLAALNAWTAERLEGLETVQLTADEERAHREYGVRLLRYRDVTVRTNVYDALLFAAVDGISVVTTALILWYASGGLLGAFTTAGTIAAFVDYLGKLFTPVQEFSQKVAVLQRAAAALEKVFSLLDQDERIADGPTSLPAAQGAIRLRDVRFGYAPGADVLHGVDLDLQPGEVVALCGRTGSGKTTLGALLSRAYDGYRGSITLDGHELTDLATADVRRAVASVRQDVQLLPDTVRFNLTLGREVPDARLWEVLTSMRADDVVRRLGGLDATIDPGGRNLSGGEAQLVALTRTLLADPAVVVLDEATASVDPLTEARVQAAVDVVLSRKTTLVIAHRLTTVLGADRIVLLDGGQVLEVGSHTELMSRDGAYAHLFRQQFTEDAPAVLPA
jgi:ATP-binding cassette subfamily B multidrug efflux pump